MKKIFIVLISFLITTICYAQNDGMYEKRENGDRIVLELFSDLWQDAPEDISVKGINLGSNVYIMYNFQFGKSIFSFAAGLGIGTNNFNSDARILNEFDTNMVATGNIIFEKLPKTVNNKDIEYKTNKLTLAYVDMPIEFRLKTESKFRTTLGFKAGFLINSHTKYYGDDYGNEYNLGMDEKIKVKYHNIKNIELLRYGITAKIGYKWINFTVFYSLSNIFKDGKGPEMYPISVGLAFIPW